MKKAIPIIISVLIFAVGLGVMFYPTFSNWMHAQNASYAVSDYFTQASNKTNEDYEAEFAAARVYNDTLTGNVVSFIDAQMGNADSDYWSILDATNGIMGVIEIPSINVTLPIYHGSEEEVLQKGVGHLEGSALPTGDVGNHTVLTGHTGLPTAMLFTDLDELVLGDYFYLEILDQVFVYEVCNIYVVLPSDTSQLAAQADKDLVTLVTCTPYGVNSHRLLVQGERVETPETETLATEVVEARTNTTSNPLANLPILVLVAMGCGVLFVVAVVVFLVRGQKNPKRVTDQATAKQQTKEYKKQRKSRQCQEALDQIEEIDP